MKKATFMNLVTVAAYAAIAVYIFVALVTFFVWVTGGFRKYTDQAGGLKFDCMAVSIADNYDEEAGTGIANLRVLSEKAVAKINTRTQKVEYSDPSEPIEIRLEVRDENGKLNNKIIDVPSKVMLGEEFQIKAVLDNDGFNKGGDCFLYAFSGDDMLSASPLPVFVDVPIQSASLLYYNIDVDPATMYKRVITQERKKTVDEKEVVDYFQTTLLYRTLQDYQNDVNAIVPLNRKTDSSSVENNALSSRFLLGDEQSVQHYKDLSFVEDSVQCVKDDQFKLYVEVYPSRAINPHSNTSISSQYLLNNLDAESIYAVCQDLIAQYNKNKDSEEAMQTYLQMFSNVWDSLGINGYVDVSGLITKTRISQAIEKISTITVAGIQNYYSTALGSQVNFSNKTISYNTPDYRVAEVDNATGIITIKSTPSDRVVSESTSLVNVSVQKIFDGSFGDAKVYNTVSNMEEESLNIENSQQTSFKIVDVYFEGLALKDGTTAETVQRITQRLTAPLYVGNNRLLVSAQELTTEQRLALLASNSYNQSEIDAVVNLGVVIVTSGNNSASNPNPLKDELKNIDLTINVSGLLDIRKDTTTLGDENVIWIITPLRATATNEQFSLTLSLTQELSKITDEDQKYLENGSQQTPDSGMDENENSEIENDPMLNGEEGEGDGEGQGEEPQPEEPGVDPQPEQPDEGNSVSRIVIYERIVGQDEEGRDIKVYSKVSSILGFGFNIKITVPNLQYETIVNTTITKYDFNKSDEINKTNTYSPIDVLSLLNTEYNPLDYTYGSVVYVVLAEGEGGVVGVAKDNKVVNVAQTNSESPEFTGQLFISDATVGGVSGVVIDNSNRYRFIQQKGAGTVWIVPVLVRTMRVNGVDYFAKYVNDRWEVMTDEDVRNATFDYLADETTSQQTITSSTFDVIKMYDRIQLTVTEEIAEFSYFTSKENFVSQPRKDMYNETKYFATGPDNAATIYVRANSNLALPGDDVTKTFDIYPLITEKDSEEEADDEVHLSYYEIVDGDSADSPTQFDTVGSDNPIHYMMFTIWIDKLKSSSYKEYTITWFKGNDQVGTPIVIKAKDCYGDGAKLEFEQASNNATNATSAFCVCLDKDNENSNDGTYNVKLYADVGTLFTNEEGPKLSNTDWSVVNNNGNQESGSNLSLVSYIDILPYRFVKSEMSSENSSTWQYVQKAVKLSSQKCKVLYYWITYDETNNELVWDGDNNRIAEPVTEFYDYFTILEEDAEQGLVKHLYLKKLLPENVYGIRIQTIYDAEFETDNLPCVNQFVMIYSPADFQASISTANETNGWRYATQEGTQEKDLTTVLLSIELTEISFDALNSETSQPQQQNEQQSEDPQSGEQGEEPQQNNEDPQSATSATISKQTITQYCEPKFTATLNGNQLVVSSVVKTTVGNETFLLLTIRKSQNNNNNEQFNDTDIIRIDSLLVFDFGDIGAGKVEIRKSTYNNIGKQTEPEQAQGS